MLSLLLLVRSPELFLFYSQYLLLFYFLIKCFIVLFLMINTANPLISVLYFILFFFINFSLILFIGLDFFALISLLIYVGAIAVLFIFVIMLLDIRFALSYTSKHHILYFLIFFIFFILIMFIYFTTSTNVILQSVNYNNWINIFYFKPIAENVGFFITNVYYIHIFLIGLLLTLVLIILLSFILIEKYNFYNKNFFKTENIHYRRLLIT